MSDPDAMLDDDGETSRKEKHMPYDKAKIGAELTRWEDKRTPDVERRKAAAAELYRSIEEAFEKARTLTLKRDERNDGLIIRDPTDGAWVSVYARPPKVEVVPRSGSRLQVASVVYEVAVAEFVGPYGELEVPGVPPVRRDAAAEVVRVALDALAKLLDG